MNSARTKPPISYRTDERSYGPFRELLLTYEGRSEEIPIRPPDLSEQGMFIQTVRHFPVGAVLKLRFLLSDSDFEVNTRAEVRYSLPGVGVGVEFIDIPSDARNAISVQLRKGNSSQRT